MRMGLQFRTVERRTRSDVLSGTFGRRPSPNLWMTSVTYWRSSVPARESSSVHEEHPGASTASSTFDCRAARYATCRRAGRRPAAGASSAAAIPPRPARRPSLELPARARLPLALPAALHPRPRRAALRRQDHPLPLLRASPQPRQPQGSQPLLRGPRLAAALAPARPRAYQHPHW